MEQTHIEYELTAEYTGVLKLGEYELPCFVLNNGQRVIIMREVVKFLTGNKKGGLERYTNATGVREFMPQKFVDTPHAESSIVFNLNNSVAFGYEAEDIIDMLDAYLQARDAGVLHPGQRHLAKNAEIFMRSCAKVGLIALIDEATGYQEVRQAQELQVKLNAYIAEELNEWTRTFPREFFENLYRLEGIRPPVPPRPYPKRFGRYVMHFVYDTLDPDVADWLRANNPNPAGERHHHQWFTKNFGYPKLEKHLNQVMGIQKVSKTLEGFKTNLAIAFEHNRVKARAKRKAKQEREKRVKEIQGGQMSLFEDDELTFVGKD